jgi:hypothetical protein
MSDYAYEEQFDSMLTIRDRRIRVRYRRGLSEDTAYQAERARAEEMLRRNTWYAGYLYRRLAVASIEAWDTREPDGRPTAITAAALYLLPIGGLQRIVRETVQQSPWNSWKDTEDHMPRASVNGSLHE